jgi:Na+/H+ antiporter NhaA
MAEDNTRQSLARLASPLRDYLRAEVGGASVLLAATVAALVWANVDAGSYEGLWTTEFAVRIGDHTLAADLREWVNQGLMALFFFVVGLEARREFDLGELRDRRRVTLPALAAVCGMSLPVVIYLAVNAGEPSADGWGAAMSTDTAFALAVLALVGPRLSNRLRAFLVTVVVIDDLIALCVIAFVYAERVEVGPLVLAGGLFAVVLLMRAVRIRRGTPYAIVGFATWVAMHDSGIDPVVVGLAMGLLTYAYPASRQDLERASDLFREFREQPTPEHARAASVNLELTISPNERLQQRFHPLSSYVIVPLFALANIGIVIDSELLERAISSPITLGIALGYALGKPVGVVAGAWLATRVGRGASLPPVGWGALVGAGATAGIGFTVSLLISNHAFQGAQLEEAKLGVLLAAALSTLLSIAIFKGIDLLPKQRRLRLLMGRSDELVDLAVEVDPEHDHVRGPEDAPVTIVEYADFECPYCGRAEPAIREVLADFGDDVRYVFRHLPLNDVHPHAQTAAEAAEAAAKQGRFWEMHDVLMEHQGALRGPDLIRYAEEVGLDVERFRRDVREHAHAGRIARDVESAELSGVSGTPTFFVNGQRHRGAYDVEGLTNAVKLARARRLVAA